MNEDLRELISHDEKIMWEGKPDKKCFIFESIFNPLLPFALIWFLIDFSFIKGFTAFGAASGMGMFLLGFFALHLMPVWIYLFGVLLSVKRYKNLYYVVTTHAIYIRSGIFAKRVDSKPFAELSHVNLHRGIFDQKFDVGDIVCTSNNMNPEGGVAAVSISSIKEYKEVYNIVKKLQKDIYSDIMYPNDKRPDENHGYNTEYKGM